MMLLKYLKYLLAIAALWATLSTETIACLSFKSNSSKSNGLARNTPILSRERSSPETDNKNPADRGIVNPQLSGKEEIENPSWNQFRAPYSQFRGTRGGKTRCSGIIALIPETLMGLTLSATPTFYYHVPVPLKNHIVEFEMADEENNTIYRKTVNTNTPSRGIFSITIPESETSAMLKVGQAYSLHLSVMDSDGMYLDSVSVWVKRVELNPSTMTRLDRANLQESLNIYKQEAIWYDALAALAELRRTNPEDAELELQWSQILKEVELERLASDPLLHGQLVSE